jgi:CRISPR-associated endonuclease Cas3-HD
MAVGGRAACFAKPFRWAEAARIAGRLHGIGKLTADFQAYIRGERSSGCDHSTAGAQVAAGQLPKPLGQMLAFIIAGHHAGLADDLGARLARGPKPPIGWEAVAGALPAPVALRPPPLTLGYDRYSLSRARPTLVIRRRAGFSETRVAAPSLTRALSPSVRAR